MIPPPLWDTCSFRREEHNQQLGEGRRRGACCDMQFAVVGVVTLFTLSKKYKGFILSKCFYEGKQEIQSDDGGRGGNPPLIHKKNNALAPQSYVGKRFALCLPERTIDVEDAFAEQLRTRKEFARGRKTNTAKSY